MRRPIFLLIGAELLMIAAAGGALAQDRPVPGAAPVTFHVSPTGDDASDGSEGRPFRSLKRAQTAVRTTGGAGPVTIELTDGTWRLTEPLTFAAADGGRERRVVTWRAAPGAHPIISGGVPVSGWRRYEAQRDVWVADVPKGQDARQVWVNGILAQRAIRQIGYDEVTITPTGLVFKVPDLAYLADLPDQRRIEVEASGYWTYRFATVDSITRDGIVMQQPG